uniref:Tubulin tyrosine ligase like 2 n=1 Tax=Otolemur garnettii TaxID=30611 RepID=H0Y1Z8_OTOGA
WQRKMNRRAILKPLVFRVDENTPTVVQSVLLERGWDRYDEQKQSVEGWNLYWRTSAFQMAEHINLKPWQRLNHHPGTTKLTRKDNLARRLRHMKRLYSTPLYEFTPLTFVMPSDYTKFVAEYFRERQALGTKSGYWICKPAELSRGRGIIIFSDMKDFIFDETSVVQKYICNPLLVGRYKCDLRIYVCVTGFRPLTIYVYREGIARFATEKFDLSNLQNYYAHLTNCSINKGGASYEKIKEVVGHGCKWTLSRFFSYLRSWDVDDLLLWRKIHCVVTLTVLAIAPLVPVAANCFELFGFDILIDDNLKPWLLEVNYSPALSLDCSTDVSVKRRLIHDVIELVYLNGRRTEGREHSSVPQMTSSVSRGKSNRGGPNTWCSPPHRSLSRFPGTHSNSNSAMENLPELCPEKAQATHLGDMLRGQDPRPPSGKLPKAPSRLGSRQVPGRAFTAYTSFTRAPTCQPRTSPCVLSDQGKVPDSQAGNFVLIFPFNEATFGASRNGLNVKRIIQEMQKLMREQHS